jgi:hypothetical protein
MALLVLERPLLRLLQLLLVPPWGAEPLQNGQGPAEVLNLVVSSHQLVGGQHVEEVHRSEAAEVATVALLVRFASEGIGDEPRPG